MSKDKPDGGGEAEGPVVEIVMSGPAEELDRGS